MSCRVAERTEHAPDEIGQPTLLALFARCAKGIESDRRDTRSAESKDAIYENSSILGETRHLAYGLCQSFGRLEDNVEAVILKQLGMAEAEDVLMYAAAQHLVTHTPRPSCGFRKGLSPSPATHPSVRSQYQPCKAEDSVEGGPTVLEEVWPIDVEDRRHGSRMKSTTALPALSLACRAFSASHSRNCLV
jgi:hypothetical protein